MLGEVCDEATAMAVRSSFTGHLLLSTLHTNSLGVASPVLCIWGFIPTCFPRH